MRMRVVSSLGAAAIFSAAALWLLPATETQAAKAASAKAAGVAGKVTFIKGGAQQGQSEKGPFKPLRRNDDVREGAWLKTAGDGRLEVKLADGSLVRLASGTTLKLGEAKADKAQEPAAGQSKLTAGKMWASVTKAVGSESKFAVRTENAVAGVRGTTFRVNAEEDGSTLVKVYEGAVAVSNAPIVEKQKAAGGGKKGPIDFKNRTQVAAPFQEVSKEEWEKIVGQMMSIRVAKDGTQAEPTEFTAENDAASEEEKEWIAFNQERDKEAQAATPQ
ncbi:MAG: FecR family protein [Myxococcota bacterium]